jgi:hypothetical protein
MLTIVAQCTFGHDVVTDDHVPMIAKWLREGMDTWMAFDLLLCAEFYDVRSWCNACSIMESMAEKRVPEWLLARESPDFAHGEAVKKRNWSTTLASLRVAS